MEEKSVGGNQAEMSFWEHLDVLRGALFRSIVAIAIFAVVAFFFKEFLVDKIIFGPKNADFITNELFCRFGQWMLGSDLLCINNINFDMQNIELAGQFRMHILITMVAGVILAMPYLLFEMWKFIRPALTIKERKGSRGFVVVTNFLFLLGVAFGYFIIVPLAINFLANYTISDDVQNNIRIASYIRSVVTICLSTGLVYELPVVIYFLARVGIVNKEVLKKYRKHAVVLFFILSAIITPPDLISQFLVAMPLLGLYEVSIGIAGRVQKQRIPEL